MVSNSLKSSWFSNVRGDVLAGIVVALALILEAIAFAGVDPKVGLYASFCIAIVIAFAGSRPGMISAATAATALVMVNLKTHPSWSSASAASRRISPKVLLAATWNASSAMRKFRCCNIPSPRSHPCSRQ